MVVGARDFNHAESQAIYKMSDTVMIMPSILPDTLKKSFFASSNFNFCYFYLRCYLRYLYQYAFSKQRY